MGLLGSPFSRLLGLASILALYAAATGSFLSSAALSGTAARALYLLALCLFVGVGDWTTFVFGLVAFKNLPRLTFGNLQAKLFPIYFKVLTASAATALVIYAARHTGGVLRTKPSREAQYQLAVLGGALVFTLANLLVLEPKTTATMRERHKAERENKDEAVMKSLNKRFGMLHGLSSLANLLGLGLAHCHLWHLASRLQ